MAGDGNETYLVSLVRADAMEESRQVPNGFRLPRDWRILKMRWKGWVLSVDSTWALHRKGGQTQARQNTRDIQDAARVGARRHGTAPGHMIGGTVQFGTGGTCLALHATAQHRC